MVLERTSSELKHTRDMRATSEVSLSSSAVSCTLQRSATSYEFGRSKIASESDSSSTLHEIGCKASEQVSAPTKGKTNENEKPKEHASTAGVVLSSIECPAVTKVLESGIQYSARKNNVGAGDVAPDTAIHGILRSQITPDRRSESLLVRGLNPDLGKEHDDDWLPSGHNERKLPPSKRTTTKSSSEKNIIHQVSDKTSFGPVPDFDIVKREPMTNIIDMTELEFARIARHDSPPIWNGDLRQERLLEEGFVELPKAVVDYERTMLMHEETERKLAAQREFIRAQEGHQKGKDPVQYLREVTWNPEEEALQQVARGNGERCESPIDVGSTLRPIRQGWGRSTRDWSDIGSRNLNGQDTMVKFEEGFQAKSATRKHHYRPSPFDKLKDKREHGTRLARNPRAFRDRRAQHRRHKRECSALGHRRTDCTCEMLPEFFTRSWSFIPDMTKWAGGRLEFLEHMRQISTCPGHPEKLKKHCKRVLEQQNYPDDLNLASALHFVKVNLSPPAVLECDSGLQSRLTPPSPGTGMGFNLALRTKRVLQPAQDNSIDGDDSTSKIGRNVPTTPQSSPLGVSISKSATATIQPMRPMAKLGFRPLIEDSSSHLMSPHSSPSPVKSRPNASTSHGGINVLHHDHEYEAGNTPTTTMFNQLDASVDHSSLSETPCNVRKRHQSMPVMSNRQKTAFVGSVSRTSQVLQPRHQSTLQLGTADAVISSVKNMKETVKGLENMLVALSRTTTNPPLGMEPVAVMALPGANPGSSQPQRKKRKTNAERKASDKPELDPNVPHHLRLPDNALVDLGKVISGYARHVKAPYAFAWNGRLRSKYDRLLTAKDENGDYVWDYKVISRLKRA